MDRRVRAIEGRIGRFLPSFGCKMLAEIALGIHKPDSDERQAEIARFFAVVPG